MPSPLPHFRYHPDPIATGSVVASELTCEVCDQARGYVYDGPVYGDTGDEGAICPWCIADGRAARLLDIELTDVGIDVPDDIPVDVIDELVHRTPGFTGWQQEHFLFHCDDGAAYLGPFDGPDGPTYRFRCLVCGEELTYSDEE